MKHELSTEDDRGLYLVWCTCGWTCRDLTRRSQGPMRHSSREVALGHGEKHVREVEDE